MKGIVININPVLFTIGSIEIRWYSIMILLAIIAAIFISIYQMKKKGLDPNDIISLVPWVLIGGIVGARLFHVIDRWDYYSTFPSQILALHQGGLAIWGAMAGGFAALLIYAGIRKVPLGRFLDAVTPGLIIAQIIGRFGCIVNGDATGGVTNLPWGFIYTHPNAMVPADLFGIPTHPYPVYEMLWNGLSLLILLRLRRYFAKDGLFFLGYLGLYATGRFILTFVRQENIWFLGLQEAQVIAILILVFAVGMFLYVRNRKERLQPVEEKSQDDS